MRKKPSHHELVKMSVTDVIYRKIIDSSTLNKDCSILKNTPVFEFALREDGALLCFQTTSTSSNSDMKLKSRSAKPFKIKSGLRFSRLYHHVWYRKRTPDGHIMGIKNTSKWQSFENDSDRYQEIFNELDIKLIRAARDSAIRKLKEKEKESNG